MPGLNLHAEVPAPKKSKNRNLKVVLGIAVLVAVPVIGTTLAASITINSGSVQFGQGYSVAAACDSAITVTPNSTFVETTNTFSLGTVTISDLDATTCASKTLRIRFYPTTSGSDSALVVSTGSSTTDALVVTMPASGTTAPTKESGADYSTGTISGTLGSSATFTITLTTKPATTSIDRITIESY